MTKIAEFRTTGSCRSNVRLCSRVFSREKSRASGRTRLRLESRQCSLTPGGVVAVRVAVASNELDKRSVDGVVTLQWSLEFWVNSIGYAMREQIHKP